MSTASLAAAAQGVATPEDCFGEFVTDGNKPSYLTYDRIPFGSNLLDAQTGVTSATDCQKACSDEPKCQYYEFYSYSAAGTGNDQCYLRLASAAVAKDASFSTSTTGDYILFEVSEDNYVVYKAKSSLDAANVGIQIAGGLTFDAAKTACDKTAACIGISGTGGSWRTFQGITWEGAVGKIKVVGETLNSWIDAPAP